MSLPADLVQFVRQVLFKQRAILVELTNDADTPLVLLTDEESGALVIQQFVHHQIHTGWTFYAAHLVEGVADDGTLRFLMRVDASIEAHLVWDAAAGGNASIALSQVGTVTGVGTPITPAAMNRELVRAPHVLLYHTPTVSNLTALGGARLLVGGTVGGSRGSSAALRENTEWILRPGFDYALTLTNLAGNAQPLGIAVQWYEIEE